MGGSISGGGDAGHQLHLESKKTCAQLQREEERRTSRPAEHDCEQLGQLGLVDELQRLISRCAEEQIECRQPICVQHTRRA
eukprot:CAMPEP_0179871838 /NCGR_PEP_ID=MMETSP0982-20121206/21164_1 /TAXON_ID=483367 /ORGANISM="non described non described, Strain CCMP 2436" /LENGTH=80 /DNA_ID=CAMNT_0021762785 /DNA_START=1329 /DNA_END=1570 /DNA_ORIENTATION=-